MSKELTINQTIKSNLRILEKYVPIVARVHGQSHPEFFEVKELFDTIMNKIKEAGVEMPNLTQEFKKLRDVTTFYTVPSDVCESYEAVYNMLAVVDEAYHKQT